MTQVQLASKGYEITQRQLRAFEKLMVKRFLSVRNNVKELVKDAYVTHLTGVDPADYYITMRAYKRMETLDKKMRGLYMSFYGGQYNAIKSAEIKAFTESFYRTQYSTALFGGGKFAVLNPLVAELSVTGDMEVWKKIRDKRLKQRTAGYVSKSGKVLKDILADNARQDLIKIQQVIKQGLIKGESFTDQARALNKTFNGAGYNALRVVRTEGNRNVSVASFEYAKASPVKMKKMWVATMDGKTRSSHGQLDGVTLELDEYFEVNGLRTLYPGGFGVEEEDINCRCTVAYILPDVPPTARRVKDPVTKQTTIASYENYDTWLKDNLD